MVRSLNSWGLIALGLVLLLQAGAAGTVVLRERFDEMDTGKGPRGGWQVSGTGDGRQVLVTDERYKDYTQDRSCRLTSTPGQNVWLRSKSLGKGKTRWIDAWIFMDSDVAAANGAVLGCIDDSGNFPCDLRLTGEGKGSGTYKATVLSGDGTGGGNKWQALAMGLTAGKWDQWSFGVQITNANGDGFYWVYRNGQPLAVKQPYRAWRKVAVLSQVQFWGDVPRWYVDEVTVADTIPDRPAVSQESSSAPAFYEPKNLGSVAYGLAVTPAGQMKVSLGDVVFSVGSQFSRPGGGILFLGPAEGEDKANQSWSVKVTKVSDVEYRVEGQTERYGLRRTVVLSPNRIQIADTFTNRTDRVQGVRFTNEVRVPEFDAIRVGGDPWSSLSAPLNNPERPFVQVVKHNVSLGLIARDDVYRNQSVDYAERGACGVRDDNFGLPPHGSYTTKWELYPVASRDPFDFYNTVRAVWGTARATIPGLYAFIFRQHKWARINKTLAEMSVEEMRDWLNTNKVQYMCFIVESDTGSIEAFGSEYLTATKGKAYWRSIVERLRKANPNVKICPYFHMGADIQDETMKDCRVMLLGGQQKTFTNYAKIARGYYYATPTNAFGRRIRQVFDMAVADFNSDTFYWDEYGDGNVSTYMENVPDWDNCSVVIDPKTNEVTKKITNVALIHRAMREELTARATANGRVLWTNWEPTTEHDTAQNIPHFLECFYDGQYVARGYLASPLQLEDHHIMHSNAEVMADAWKFLQKGLLYVHNGSGAFAEMTESMLGRFYPITPTELHEGYILGKERIITSRSGAFGFGDNGTFDAFIYDAKGLLKRDKGRTIVRDGRRYQLVELGPGEIAIVVKDGGR